MEFKIKMIYIDLNFPFEMPLDSISVILHIDFTKSERQDFDT